MLCTIPFVLQVPHGLVGFGVAQTKDQHYSDYLGQCLDDGDAEDLYGVSYTELEEANDFNIVDLIRLMNTYFIGVDINDENARYEVANNKATSPIDLIHIEYGCLFVENMLLYDAWSTAQAMYPTMQSAILRRAVMLPDSSMAVLVDITYESYSY